MRRFLSLNALSVVFLLVFLGTVTAQAVAGHADYNSDQVEHNEPTASFTRYLTSSAFGQAVMENWQSEYLQFSIYILGTIYLIQRGSPESKKPGEAGKMSDEEQLVGRYARDDSPGWARAEGARRWVYEHSLVALMGSLFLGTWFAHSVCGWSIYNQDQLTHHSHDVSYWQYLGSSDFWQTSLQNWQSEFLAIGSMAIFSVYLRQRGSPESKPVGAPHTETGSAV